MRNLHQEITDRIVARLKAGVCPWRQPWSSAFLCGEFGFDNDGADAAYIAHWVSFLTDHSGAIITAAAAASRAVEFMRGLALEDNDELEPLALAA